MIEDVHVPQQINLTLTVPVEVIEGKKVSIAIPKELRLTAEAFNFIHQMVAEQGFELANMNIADVHREEVKDLPNVSLVDKQTA